ncbi:MAG: STAS domain-containing protein [Planctomycetota bacterium]|nr:STAS domain-containing protein [Planctomycetota bacterium]
MAQLKITVTLLNKDKSLGLIALEGDVGSQRVQEFQKSLDAHLEQGVKYLIIDMEKIVYFNTALGALVKNANDFRMAGGGIALLNVPSKINIVLDMLDLDRFFAANCKDLATAINALLPEATKE